MGGKNSKGNSLVDVGVYTELDSELDRSTFGIESSEHPPVWKSYITLSNGLQLFMFVGGALAGTIYKEPSADCAKMDICALWLSEKTSTDAAATIIFFSGAFGYSISNGYLSAYSIPYLLKYINEKKSRKAKVAAVIIILLFSASQAAQILLAAIATNSNLLETIFSVEGAFPAAIYGTVELATREIPYYAYKWMSFLSSYFYLPIKDHFYPPSQDVRFERNLEEMVEIHYVEEQKKFLLNVKRNWKTVKANVDKIRPADDSSDLVVEILFRQAALLEYVPVDSWPTFLTRTLGEIFGVLVSTIFSLAFMLSTVDTLESKVGIGVYLSWVLAFLTGITVYYANYAMTIPASGAMALIGKSLFTRDTRDVDSLMLNIRPKTTLAIFAFSALTSALSYSIIGMMADKYYDGPAKTEFRYGSMIGIVEYHIYAIYLFFNLMYSRLIKETTDKQLIQLEEKIYKLPWQTPKDFTMMIEKMPADALAICKVRKFESGPSITDEEDAKLNFQPLALPSIPQSQSALVPRKKTCWETTVAFFCCKKLREAQEKEFNPDHKDQDPDEFFLHTSPSGVTLKGERVSVMMEGRRPTRGSL